MTTHLVIGDQHAHPNHNNDRADWLNRLIFDFEVTPDVIVNIGDAADMPSLCMYDRGKRSFHGKNYAADIEAHLDFQARLFRNFKHLSNPPRCVFIEGNHEHRIEKALDLDPYLVNTIGFKDFQLEEYYDDIIRYNGDSPGIINIDGVIYSHFISSGVLGKPVGGEHPAYTTLSKKFQSCTQGHSHIFDYCMRTKADGEKLHSLILPAYQDYICDWAGETQSLWDRGVVIKRNVQRGQYDLEYISMNTLQQNGSSVT